jgi:adenylate cyclase
MTQARVRVYFEPGAVLLELAPGERLLDVADDRRGALPLPTACRAGNCGACLVRIREGAEWLEPASSAERATLGELRAAPDQRLGCQLHARGELSAGPPTASVRVEAVRR